VRGGARRDWNGIHYKQDMSAKNVGTTKLSANIATIPPGEVAAAQPQVHSDESEMKINREHAEIAERIQAFHC
jgi:uncharacterized RmlC-like cupin family protein